MYACNLMVFECIIYIYIYISSYYMQVCINNLQRQHSHREPGSPLWVPNHPDGADRSCRITTGVVP